MTDLFEEVEEQLRSDRYRDLARRVIPWMLGLAAAAIVATLAYWGWDYSQRQTMSKASETYAQAMEALQGGNADRARQLLTETAKSSAKAYKSLSLMHLGAFALNDNHADEAVKLFDQAAAAAPDPIIGDAARLKSAFALLDTAPYKDLEGRLAPLTKDDRPYRLQAREALAFAKLKAGDTAGARGDFVVLSQALGGQQSLQGRANAAIALIDSGAAGALPALVKAELAAPPSVTLAPAPAGDEAGAPQPQTGVTQ